MVSYSTCLYRYLKAELRHLSYLSGELDSGNICPACPKVNSTYTLPQNIAGLDKYQVWLIPYVIGNWECCSFHGCSVWTPKEKGQPDKASENPFMGTSTLVTNRQL